MLFFKQSVQTLDIVHKLGSYQHWTELVTDKNPTKQSVPNIVNSDCAYDITIPTISLQIPVQFFCILYLRIISTPP